MTAGRAAFEMAVAEYELAELPPPDHVLAVAADSLDRTGLLLLGEIHGVAQTPNAILGLVSRIHVRALALEWSYDELDEVVQPVLTTGAIDSDALWALPPSAEVFSGDGRFTAGHVRMLEHLGDRLESIVLLDRAGSEGSGRASGMVQRLLAPRRPDLPMLAVLGLGHVVRAPEDGAESVALLVDRELSGVANGILAPSSGTCWFHGEAEVPCGDLPPADVIVPIGIASPAVVPQHPAGIRCARRA
ncbi:MAG: hypothetical protein ACRDOF_01520 [Gaiellaceae bacterium]